MKNISSDRKIFITLVLAYGLFIGITSCSKIAGLPLQTNQPFLGGTINPNTGMTAWDYIKSRGPGKGDSLFSSMYQAIIYSGIDTNLYVQPNTTYILYSDSAIIYHNSNGGVSTSSYWGHYKVKVNGKSVAATSWSQYSPDSVKNNLLYLIIPGVYNANNIPISYELNNAIQDVITVWSPNSLYIQNGVKMSLFHNTLDSLVPYPNNLICLSQSDSNSTYQAIYINAFPGTTLGVSKTSPTVGVKVSTSNIIAKNGIMHSVDKVIYY